MIFYLRLALHRLILLKWYLLPRSTAFDFYGEAIRSIVARWHGEFEPVITYNALFNVLRQQHFSGNFLELGGGYSTILARMLFDSNNVEITSVDFNPAKYHRILNSRKNTRNFLKTIKSINEITVSFSQVEEALNKTVDRLLAYQSNDIKLSISKFVTDEKLLNRINAYIGESNKKAICRLVTDHEGFKNEIDFYHQFGAMTGEWACNRIADSRMVIDAVFLDCGEVSSLAEFLALENRLVSWSYVLLHDIYFPKSIKNFLLGTLLSLDPAWEILYQDSISKQGGMVARKL